MNFWITRKKNSEDGFPNDGDFPSNHQFGKRQMNTLYKPILLFWYFAGLHLALSDVRRELSEVQSNWNSDKEIIAGG